MFSKRFTRVYSGICAVAACMALTACGAGGEENRVIIYSGAEDYRNEYMLGRLNEQFPDYDIKIEYYPTGNLAAKIHAEGTQTECDIVWDLDYSYAAMAEPYLADLSEYDQSAFTEDMQVSSARYLPEYRNGGAIIVNLDVLEEKGLAEPTGYHDLTDEKWKGLISMPAPKSSGTGYMFLKSLVNAWGEDEAFAYFDALTENILQYTTSGSGPVNALIQGEAAVGLGMTGQAVMAINEGVNLKILYFEEGSPSSFYGYGIIDGKQNKKATKDVFDFLYTTLVDEDKERFFPERIYKDKTFEIENYPSDIRYADMSGNTNEEKMRLLEKWKY